MKTEWDYTNLAEAYLQRPGYAPDAISQILRLSGVQPGDRVCDMGAGAAHLTLELLKYGLYVCAVEPNDAMRANGLRRTSEYQNVVWMEGVGEQTCLAGEQFALVTFGSSFNVCDRQAALKETARILRPDGWFSCIWNHRDLNDPLQAKIESIIRANIPDYQYGTRREDQTEVIASSGLFTDIQTISGTVMHQISADALVEGWKSHGTVYRQSPERFDQIISEIRGAVSALKKDVIEVPYTTRGWIAKRK